jgi:hypothetical protein
MTARRAMKDAKGRDRHYDPAAQAKRNREDYLRRKRGGYYVTKRANMTQAERDADAIRNRAKRHANGAAPRSTNAELTARRQAILDIAEAQQPATVRAIFYQCVVGGIVGKGDYKIVQSDLKVMRQNKLDTPMAGSLPFEWVVDTSRSVDHPMTFTDAADALRWLPKMYRQSLWDDAKCVVQVWLEKDALSGVLAPVTKEYDVPLLVARGFSSLSFLNEAAQGLVGEKRPVFVYHFGDHDYYGRKASAAIDNTLRERAPGVNIKFTPLAVTLDQIKKWKLPTRPDGLEGVKADEWDGKPTVELDAIAPNRLRDLLKSYLSEHLPDSKLKRLRIKEASERDDILSLTRR